jgi:hypothetical protein
VVEDSVMAEDSKVAVSTAVDSTAVGSAAVGSADIWVVVVAGRPCTVSVRSPDFAQKFV